MDEYFLKELKKQANNLTDMLEQCEPEVANYVINCVKNNCYIMLEDFKKVGE